MMTFHLWLEGGAVLYPVVSAIYIAIKINQLKREVKDMRKQLSWRLPDVGGRPVPTTAELAAARNRIDSSGIAHPGGP